MTVSNSAIGTRRDCVQQATLRQGHITVPPAVLYRRPATRAVYAALLACLEQGIDDPRQNELTRVAGVSLASVVRALDELEAAELVTRERTPGTGRPLRYALGNQEQAQP